MTQMKQMIRVAWLMAVLLLGGEIAGGTGIPKGNINEVMEQQRAQAVPTATPVPTSTPTPTNTPTPTSTPTPTKALKETLTPTPTSAGKYTFAERNLIMYATQNVNIRSLPNTSGNVLGTLWSSDGIWVTGKCNEVNWYRVEYDGKTAYIYGAYLTATAPTPTPAPPVQYANSLCVDEEGTVYVLDLYDTKLVTAEGAEFGDSIDLPGCVLPADVCLADGKFYVYDEVLNEVLVYTKNGELLSRTEIPLTEDYIKRFDLCAGPVSLLTYGGKKLVFSETTGTFTEEIYEEKQVYSDGFDFVEYLGEDASGIRYSLNTTLIKNCSVLAGEIMICASSEEGEFLGGYNIPTLECEWLPDNYVCFTEDGAVYVLLVKEEEVIVEKVELVKYPESQLAQIEKMAKNTEAGYKKSSDARIAEKKTYTKAVALTRNEVYQRVVAIAEYEWMLTPQNTNLSLVTNARLPRYITNLIELMEGQADWELAMTGIPYCWGGFNSLYGTKSTRFSTVIAGGEYLAGNINTVGEYRGDTAGLDCSGFVSSVFGTSWKLNTRHFADMGSLKKDLNALEQMDIFVAPSDHIVIFLEWIDEGTILASEAAIRDGRVTIHPRTINSFLIEGTFQMRSPW